MKSRQWFGIWLFAVLGALTAIGCWIVRIDPFFHYHKPDTERYFYVLDSERNQNDGITRQFDYDALITGTSMTENFKTSELEDLFGVRAVKVPASGGTFKEINDIVRRALQYQPKLKLVVRGLDLNHVFSAPDSLRQDLGKYPEYLYDNNLFNDVEYVFNRSVVFSRAYQMELERKRDDFAAGITSFDSYENWMDSFQFGIHTVCPDGIEEPARRTPEALTEEEFRLLEQNVQENVISLAAAYPDVTFYYFFPPYSAVWWRDRLDEGSAWKYAEAQRYIAEQSIPYHNIKLFSFFSRTDLTTDLNNYKDETHYGEWISSLILKWMHDGTYRLTEENYEETLLAEYDYYASYLYSDLNGQPDYTDDSLAAAFLHEELSGIRQASDADAVTGDKA